MIFLSKFFSDDYYKESLNTNPVLSVRIVGDKSLPLMKSLIETETLDFQIHITFSDSLDEIKPKKRKLNAAPNKCLLKSKWCYKHQYQNFGCILFTLVLCEHHSETASDQLNFLLRQVNHRLICSNIVIVCITPETINDIDKEFLGHLHQLSKKMLSERLYSFTAICVNSTNHFVVSNLRKTLVNAALDYHKNEITRLKEKNKLLSHQNSPSPVARVYFKIAWHYLILRKYEEAKKKLMKAYRVLRTFFPNFPPFDVRMVASLLLMHIISVLPLCGEVLSVKSELFEAFSSHINWVGSALTSEYNYSCRKLVLALRSALVAEWCETLARKTLDISPLMRSDLLISAANNLQQIKSISENALERKAIFSPVYIGTECFNDTYADVFFGMFKHSVLSVHICRLLEEASATSTPEYRKFEKSYFELCAQETLSLNLLENLLDRDWHSLYVSDFFSALVLDKCKDIPVGTSKDELIYYILINGCVSPLSISSQTQFCRRLEKLSERPAPTLRYPYGSFQPPFTVVAQIEHDSVEASEGRAPLILTFFTTSVKHITLSNIQISLLDINCLDVDSGMLQTSLPGSYEIEARESTKANLEITFPQNGKYICHKLWATASIGISMFDVVWSLHQLDGEVRSKRSPILAKKTILNVTKPISFAKVSSTTCVDAVEYENFEVTITVEGKESLLTNVSISFPYLPEFFSGALFCFSAENGDIKLCENILRSKDGSVYALNDISPEHTMSFVLRGKCLRSGMYQVPIIFRHSTKDFVNMEIVRISLWVINPPFSVDYFCFTSTLWCSYTGEVNLPTTNSVYQQRDSNILEKPRDSKLLLTSTSTAEWYSKNTSLYYAVRDKDASSKAPLRTSVGEMVTFLINLICTAGKKITVLKSDVICSEELQLHSLSFGELPCVLDEEESVSIVAQLCARKKGVLSPGFVRILFKPQFSSSPQLVADLSLPLIIIEDAAIKLKYVYPSTVLFGYIIILKLVIVNMGKELFRGELLVDTRSDCFSIGGRTRWNLTVCPQDNTEERIELIPLKVGELPLPLIRLNDIHGSPVVAHTNVAHHVTVFSGQQPCSNFDTLIQVT